MTTNNQFFFEAIALRKCIVATYNRMRVTLAPHILYTRHDELFIDAVTLERDGQPPKEIKLGVFKLIGLNDVEFAGKTFDPDPIFDAKADRYAGTTVFAIEPA